MDFNKVNKRYNTYSTQWDYTEDRFGSSEVLPFSISDTDFQVPPEIKEALHKIIDHGIYGYTRWNHRDFKASIKNYFQRRHKTNIDSDWIVYSPSVMYSIAVLIRSLSRENEGVVSFTPMYDAFFKVIQDNNRKLYECKLNDDFSIDFVTLEHQLKQAKIFLLCSPHNPTGRVWNKSELYELICLCKKHDVWILSDEIHSDVIHSNHPHIPILHESIEYDKIILITSSSKIFNTPALIGSYAIIPDVHVRETFMQQTRNKDFLNSASRLGIEALMVGYNDCDYYIDELVDYVNGNLKYLQKELAEIGIDYTIPEATYLAWIDVSSLKIEMDLLQKYLVHEAKLGIMSGAHYGDSRYLRLNCGCPRVKLEEGLNRLKRTINRIKET